MNKEKIQRKVKGVPMKQRSWESKIGHDRERKRRKSLKMEREDRNETWRKNRLRRKLKPRGR